MKSVRPSDIIYSLTIASLALLVSGCIHKGPAIPLQPKHVQQLNLDKETLPRQELTLVSLNLAHGRADHFSQVFLSHHDIRAHLDRVALFLNDIDADIVALQELDGPSAWSGSFNHDLYISKQTPLTHSVRTDYVQAPWGHYGSGILTNLPVTDALGSAFAPSFPTPTKGFTLTEVDWPDGHGQSRKIDVLSVHLDFSRASVRRHQISQLTHVLDQRDNPRIIMGDFNSDGVSQDQTLHTLMRDAQVHTHELNSPSLASFGNRRLDWIFLSPELEFTDYYHSEKVLSDHLAVVAKVRFKTNSETLYVASP